MIDILWEKIIKNKIRLIVLLISIFITIIVLIIILYKRHIYIHEQYLNKITINNNERLKADLKDIKNNLYIIEKFQDTGHISALIDYKLNSINGLQINNSYQEENDGLITTVKNISFFAKNINEVIQIINYISKHLSKACCILNKIDLRHTKDLFEVYIDFYTVSIKV